MIAGGLQKRGRATRAVDRVAGGEDITILLGFRAAGA